jgi:hypothetical protein
MRLQQGTNPYVGSLRVGVMNVYVPADRPGTIVAQLALFDPASGEQQTVYVTAGDELALGAHRYRVACVATGDEGTRDWLEIEPIEDSLRRRPRVPRAARGLSRIRGRIFPRGHRR